MRRAAGVGLVLACASVGGGCASILGIEEQTFDGVDGTDVNRESEAPKRDAARDSDRDDRNVSDARSGPRTSTGDDAPDSAGDREDSLNSVFDNDGGGDYDGHSASDASGGSDVSAASDADADTGGPCPQCAGCCDQAGACTKGTSATACGVDGVYCVDCTATGLTCHFAGVCR